MSEIRPEMLAAALLLVLAVASVLTLVGSWLVLWRYRSSVARAMSLSGIGQGSPERATIAASDAPGVSMAPAPNAGANLRAIAADRLFRRAARAPRVEAACQAVAALAYALVLASSYLLAFPEARTPTRLLLTLWVDLWPLVIVAAFTGPGFARRIAVGAALYFAPFVLATSALLIFPETAPETPEAALLALRETVTPRMMAWFWLIHAGAPTGVLLLFLNPRLRAVSPMMLAFTTIVLIGLMAAGLALSAAPIQELILDVTGATAAGWAGWLLLVGTLVGAVALAAWAGWLALRRIRRATLAKTISDRSLATGAVWLFFASTYSMQFVVRGVAWLLTGVLAFAAYAVVLSAAQRVARRADPALPARGLTFLRVFALGPKGNALFEALAKHWRRIGSMQLITGPDVAHSTVQPPQLLDFIAGRLDRHFIADARTLETRLDLLDRRADRDGWYRVNNLFCRADMWKAVLARLVQQGDVVLMDLRSFSAVNAGCVHELRHLVAFVPLARCVFIVDATTDIEYIRSVLRETWAGLDASSPNRQASAESVELHRFDPGGRGLRGLLHRLCHAA